LNKWKSYNKPKLFPDFPRGSFQRPHLLGIAMEQAAHLIALYLQPKYIKVLHLDEKMQLLQLIQALLVVVVCEHF